MKRLWARLTVAFVAIAVLSAAIVSLFANLGVGARFQRYLAQSRIAELGLIETLQDYYARRGSWAGVDEILTGLRGRGQGPGPGAGRGDIVVADAAGRTVSPATRAGAALTASERDQAVAIGVDGQTAGYALVAMPSNAQFTAAATLFLSDINLVLAQAALLAAAAGALAGVAIARGLSGPLTGLAAAARRVAQGRLDERVRAGGSQEVEDLAAAFNEMTDDLQQADLKRREAETLRRNMVADIAHELRTPLTVMQGNLQAILDDVYPLTKDEIATLCDQTSALRRLVNDLRELSLAEAGQLELQMSAQRVGPLLERAAQRFGELIEARGLGLSVDVEDGLPAVSADPGRVAQVIDNLIANAIRHTPAGGRVTLRASRVSGGARIEVADTGPGIPEADLPRVFDRFWRGDKSRARDTGGSGLGLAIARQWVEAMGGEIGVASAPGAGSRFWFALRAA